MIRKKQEQNQILMQRAAKASVIVAWVLIALKGIVFYLTGSVAILSVFFDSVQDMMTSLVAMIAVKQAAEPADKHHRFGHGKAQAVGSLIQGFIILTATLFLVWESLKRFWEPQALAHSGLGILVTVVAIVLSALLVRYQTFVIRRTGSLAIRADQAHYTGDIWMNIGVIIAMEMTNLTGWAQWDALFGLGVAGYLFVVVGRIVRDAIGMLMDTEMPQAFRKQIKAIAHSFPDVTAIHDLKTRQSGNCAFVQFCVHMTPSLTLAQAHRITDDMESKIRARFPETEVIIHPEPERNFQ